jgi:hypothetical protein
MAGEQNIDELLARLAKVKPLPNTNQPFRTEQAALGSQVRDAAGRAFGSTPSLQDAIGNIQRGGSAQTGWKGTVAGAIGSPIGKALLGGLNVIDAPRRAVISTVKEVGDYLDTDPNTKGSLREWKSQFSDPSFGFGRVLPGKGWGGRLVGFIGDVALDPLTYATLGGSVPLKAAGASRLLQAGASKTLLRRGVNVTGREGRFALATVAKEMGQSPEVVARIASHGKSAVPAELAKTLGLSRNGLYMFGSRVRLPFTGAIGGALEHGIVKTRLALTNTNIGKKLQYLYTPRGGGVTGDVSKIRADLASGRVEPSRVNLAMASLNGVESGRRVGAAEKQVEFAEARKIVDLDDVKAHDNEIHRFIETGNDALLSTSQLNAKRAVQGHLERIAQKVETFMRRLDPSWELPRVRDPQTGELRYVPHILTDKSRRWMEANLDNAWVQRLESYLKVDVMDMRNNFAGRYIRPGVDFLESGRIVQTGSIDEINSLFKEVTGQNFDLFETSTRNILGGYVDSVRAAAEVSTLLGDLQSSDFIRLLRTQGEIDPEYADAMKQMVKEKLTELERLSGRTRAAANSVVDVVRQQFDERYRRGVVDRLRTVAGDVSEEISTAGRGISAADKAAIRLDELTNVLSDVVAKQQLEAKGLAAYFEEKNAVMSLMDTYIERNAAESKALVDKISQWKKTLDEAAEDSAQAQRVADEVAASVKKLSEQIEQTDELLKFYKVYGDEFGPILQDVFNKMRDAVSSSIDDGTEAGTQALIRAGERYPGSSDPRVNRLLGVLLKPFDNEVYKSSMDLGEDWVRTTVNSGNATPSGRLLATIDDLGGVGTKAQRSTMGRKGGRSLRGGDIRQIVARAFALSDNPEQVADAFFVLTLKDLRSAFDAHGGGATGLAAQEALAQELIEGTTARAKMWKEANDAVKKIVQARKVVEEIGSRRTQLGGKYSTSSNEAIDRLRTELAEAQSFTDPGVAARSTELGDAFSRFSATGTLDDATSFLNASESMFNEMGRASTGLAGDETYVAFLSARQQLVQMLDAGDIAGFKRVAKPYYDQMMTFAETEFSDIDAVRDITRKLSRMESEYKKSFEIDKQANDASATLTDSVHDASIKLSNFHILHTARQAVDAAQKIIPDKVEVGESLWAIARSGAARQELEYINDFERTVNHAHGLIEQIRDKTYGAKPAERAAALRSAVSELSDSDREQLYRVVGNLDFIEKGKLASKRIDYWRRNTIAYTQVRDDILDVRYPGWKDQIVDDISALRRTGKARSRAQIMRGTGRETAGGELGEVVFGVETAEVSQAIEAARQRQNKLNNISPDSLVKIVDELFEKGDIDAFQRGTLLSRIRDGEEAAKESMSRAKKGGEYEITDPVTGEKKIVPFKTEQRSMTRAVAGAARAETETYGPARIFSRAVRTRSDGSTLSQSSIDEFFVRMLGDGEVRVGDGVTFKQPVAQRKGEEIGYAEGVDAILRDKKEIRAARLKNVKYGTDEYWDAQYDYWRDLSGVLDSERAIRRVNQIRQKNGFIANMKQTIKAMEDRGEKEYLIATERRELVRLQKQVKGFQKELEELERDSRQLYSSGVYRNPVQMRYVSISESHIGKIAERTRNRGDVLRTLSVDPNATEQFTIASGTTADRTLIDGPFGYAEYLRSRVRGLDAAAKAYDDTLEKIGKIRSRAARASAAKRAGLEDAEAIAENPELFKRVTQAIEGDADLLDTDTKWLGASRLGQTYDAEGRPQRKIPERVVRLLNEVRDARIELARIESSVDYTRALQRNDEHSFFMTLARLDLDKAALKSPPTAYNEQIVGALYTHPVIATMGLDKETMQSIVLREVDRASVVNDLLQANNKHMVIVDGKVMDPQAVTDSIRVQNNGKFRYIISQTDGGATVVFTDKGTSRQFSFPVESVPSQTLGQAEVVMDSPVYMSLSRNTVIAEQYASIVAGRPMTTYKKGKVLLGGQEDYFVPERTFVTYRKSGTGEIVAFNMRELGFGVVGKETSPFTTRGLLEGTVPTQYPALTTSTRYVGGNLLAPEVVFDPAAGRGLTAENFEYIFTKPYSSPGSAEARALRKAFDVERGKLDDLYKKYESLRQQAREATTDKARRAAQSKAGSVQELIDSQTAVVAKAEERLRGGLPANHYGSVRTALNVLDYFKRPDVRKSLGMRVDETVTAGDIEDVPFSVALDAFKRYVRALEFGDISPAEGAVRTPLVLDTVKDARQKYLREAWNASPEKAVIDTHKGNKAKAAAAAKELDVIKRGGPGEELHSALLAARTELQRYGDDVSVKTADVRAAIAKAPSDLLTDVVPDQPVADMGRALLGRVNERLKNEFAVRFSTLPQEDISLLLYQTNIRRGFDYGQAAAAAALDNAKAREAGLAKQLEELRRRQDVLKVQVDAMQDVVDGKAVTATTARVLPDDFRHLRDELYGNRRNKIEGVQQRIEKTVADLAAVTETRQKIEAQIVQQRSVVDTGFYANLSKKDAERRLGLIRGTIDDLKEIRRKAKRPAANADDWQVEFDQYVAELDDVIQRVAAMPDGPDTRRLSAVVAGYMEARANELRGAIELTDAQDMQRMVASGRLFSEGDHVIFSRVLDEGWVKLTGSGSLSNFKNLQMKPEVAEILNGMNRLRDPAFVREMRRWTGPYTKFFKAWALATPGYHVRNSITNAFMLVAAGGRPAYLYEGMMEYNALYNAFKRGESVDRYIANLAPERAQVVRNAYDAMLGSGVGQSEEIAFDTAGLLTNNPWTRLNKRAGTWVEQHSRFMLAYDSVRQGLDVNAATARTRKFLFDYEDISKLDATMRSIIPFWMWTSRNFPLTIQNIYMNPRPYQWYGSLRRNLEDEEQTKSLPQYLLEAGAFALPGGNMIATPDLGFNRLQADVSQFTDPLRFASNVNPVLRVPVETMLANKTFFRNRPFSEAPVEAANPVAGALSALGQPFGLGGTDPAGNRVVNEKLYYALRNLVPVAAQFERFVPSTTEYQQRGTTNPLLGYVGAPVREFTPEMRNAELARRLAEIGKLRRAQPKAGEQ